MHSHLGLGEGFSYYILGFNIGMVFFPTTPTTYWFPLIFHEVWKSDSWRLLRVNGLMQYRLCKLDCTRTVSPPNKNVRLTENNAESMFTLSGDQNKTFSNRISYHTECMETNLFLKMKKKYTWISMKTAAWFAKWWPVMQYTWFEITGLNTCKITWLCM